MEFNIFYISYIFAVLITIAGIYALYNFRNDKLFIKLFSQYSFIFIFPLFDVLSTVVFISRYGIESESNPVGRYFMYTFEGYSFVLLFILAVINLTFLYGIIYVIAHHGYTLKTKRFMSFERYLHYNVIMTMALIVSSYIIVITINISVLFM